MKNKNNNLQAVEYRYTDYQNKPAVATEVGLDILEFIDYMNSDNFKATEKEDIFRNSVIAGLKSTKKYLRFWLKEMQNKNYPTIIPYDILLPKNIEIITKDEALHTGSNINVIPKEGRYSYIDTNPDGFSAICSDKWFPTVKSVVDAAITGVDSDIIPNKEYRNKAKHNKP